jgi:hypothetical protein
MLIELDEDTAEMIGRSVGRGGPRGRPAPEPLYGFGIGSDWGMRRWHPNGIRTRVATLRGRPSAVGVTWATGAADEPALTCRACPYVR